MNLDRDSLLTPDYVACELLKVSEKTQANWRSSGAGPPFTKVGKRVLYPSELLEQWLHVRTSRAPAPSRKSHLSAMAGRT